MNTNASDRGDTVMCHKGSSATRVSAGSVCKRNVRATVIALAQSAGHSDGETYADCVACGQRSYFDVAARDGSGFNLGHIVSDAQGGRWCACNLLPMCRTCNAELGDTEATEAFTLRYDSRIGWNGIHLTGQADRRTDDGAARGSRAWIRV